MTLIDLLGLADVNIAELYNRWSEDNYCAGWLIGGEQQFVESLLVVPEFVQNRELDSYELESIKKIRKIAFNMLSGENHE